MPARSLVVAMLLVAGSARADGDVSVYLDEARVERNGAHLLVRCRVRWVNHSGAPIEARTNFGSISDGLSIEIADSSGRVLVSQSYLQHQSPFAEDRALALPPGITRHELVFPVSEPLPRRVRVRLVGGLIGSARHATGFATAWRAARAP